MHTKKMKQELALWVERGLLTPETAAVLLDDLDQRRHRIGIAQLLTVLAAVFLSVALLLVVSANWEAIPRILRLGALVAAVWVFHLGGAWLAGRDKPVLSAASLLLGTAAFGGGLALSGQMYHISGDLVSMFIVWFAAAALTAALFRSGAVSVAAGLLALCLCGAVLDELGAGFSMAALLHPPVLALVMGGLARWSGQKKVAHFSFLMLLGWAIWLFSLEEGVPMAVLLTVSGLALFAAFSFPASPLQGLGGAVGGAPRLYSLLLCAIGVFFLHVELGGMALIFAAVTGLCIAVAALALGGAEHGGVRWISYAMLAGIIYYVSFETVGTILGTSGFFLLAALVAAGLAFAVMRLEKRLARGRRTAA